LSLTVNNHVQPNQKALRIQDSGRDTTGQNLVLIRRAVQKSPNEGRFQWARGLERVRVVRGRSWEKHKAG
jgi:hypothetical protein